MFSLKKLLIPVITAIFPALIFCQISEKFDYIFLVDCSGSMVGLPKGSGNPVIFPQVKEAIKDFLRDISVGANVIILPFHKDVQEEFSRTILSERDIKDLEAYIDNLEAKGQVTWIYYSIRSALRKAEELRKKDKLRHTQMILLYTDGKDNGPQDLNLDGILDFFKMQRGENEFLYLKYITLGVELEPEEELKLLRTEGIQLIKNPKGELPKRFPVEIRPYVLDYGNFLDKDENSRTITIQCDDQIRSKEIIIKPMFEQLDNLGVAYTISPDKSRLDNVVTISFKIFNKETLLTSDQIKFEGKFIIKGDETLLISPEAINVYFSIEPKKIINIRSKDEQRLSKDFGQIKFDKQGLYKQKWSLSITYNQFALKEKVPLKLMIKGNNNNPSLLTPDIAYFEQEGVEKGQEMAINQSANIDFILNVRKEKVKKGAYQGNIVFSSDKNVELEGDGLEVNETNELERLANFMFIVPAAPFPWKIFVVPGILLILILVFGLGNPSFYKGAVLEDESGSLVSLKKKAFKRKYLVAGYSADFVLPNLPSTIKFYIKPAARGSRDIKIIVKKGYNLKNSEGIEMPFAFWSILKPGDFVQGDELNPIKIYYKILGEE
ncbi:MAG: VWA domain-containing protein [Candidatus Aminicenantes bacterium]|nr:VWA domain-containing protein [Candidatus Aminicenantes bacterium]